MAPVHCSGMLTAETKQETNLQPSIVAPSPASRRSCWTVFMVLFAVALAWTIYTQHVWEDFYITYRASKNLAVGNGLTFTPGERVHSFTSPIGTLLPAVAYLLTGNSSDTGALWIFRLMSITAYAGTGVLLWILARRLFLHAYPAIFLIALLATDAKTIDFTTNGMETPYILLFVVWTLYALFLTPPRQAVHLGIAWAGLMWSRPDSFVYIGGLALGALLFGRFSTFWGGRWQLLKTFLLAGCITTALYGPWLLWAWWYYGNPIPHTVIAKGLLLPKPTPAAVVQWLIDFPVRIWKTGASLGTTFMPPYGTTTGWPAWSVLASRYLSVVAMLLWIVPPIRWEARIASFAFFLGHFYLTYIANFPAPWYIPTVTLLAFVALSGVVDLIVSGRRNKPAVAPPTGARRACAALWFLLPLGALTLSVFASHQMKLSQSLSETGNRRVLGEWLKANASSPNDTVFLECLGYIGFFSNLKMYDFPGLGSPEVVALRRKSPTSGYYSEYFPELIMQLEPDWVVLRDSEVERVKLLARDLLTKYYRLERVFQFRDKLNAMPFVPGRAYLDFDAHFEVYRRNWDPKTEAGPRDHVPIRLFPITVNSLTKNETWAGPAVSTNGNLAAHAPSKLAARIPDGANGISGGFGFFAGAYENYQAATPGAIFSVHAIAADGTSTEIFSAYLNPREIEAHRGDQSFTAEIPPGHTHIELRTDPPDGMGNAFGWTYWTKLMFEIPRTDIARTK